MNFKLKHTSISQLILFGIFFSIILLYYPFVQNYSVTPKWIALSVIPLFYFSFNRSPLFFNKTYFFWYLFVLQYLIQCFYSYNFWDAIAHSMPMLIVPFLISVIYNPDNSFSFILKKSAIISAICIAPLLLVSLFEIATLYLSGNYSHASTYNFRFTFGHRNQFSQFITLLVPLIFAGIFYAKRKWTKVFLYLVIFLIYTTAILLKSRAVIIVLIFIYPLIGSFYLLIRGRKKVNKYIKYSLIIVFSLGAIILISTPIQDLPYVNKLVEVSYGSGNERVRLWKNSFELFKENPLFGKGSGDWKIEILRTPLEHTQAENSNVFYNRAHNDFIQIIVENGIVGVLFYLLFFIIGIVQLFRSKINLLVKAILFSGVLAFLVFSNFSFPLEKIEHLFLLFLFLSPGMKSFNETNKLLKPVFITVTIFVLLFSILWIIEEKKYTHAIENNKLDIIQNMDKSFYSIDPTTLPLEWYIANNYFDNSDYDNAINSYLKSLKQNPFHVHAINNLGSSYFKIDELSLAENEYKKALIINPRFTETIMNYSSLCFNNDE